MKRIVPGVGYDVYETSDTVSLVISGNEAAERDHPFKVIITGKKFRVIPGTVNGVMPKMDGTSKKLDEVPPPEKDCTSTGYVYLDCQHNSTGFFPAQVTVKYASSVPASFEEALYIPIASIYVDANSARKTGQMVETSLSAEFFQCGSNAAEYYVSRS